MELPAVPWGAVESCCHGPAVLSFLTDESPGDKHEKCLQNDNNQDTAYNYLGQFYKKTLIHASTKPSSQIWN